MKKKTVSLVGDWFCHKNQQLVTKLAKPVVAFGIKQKLLCKLSFKFSLIYY